MTRTIRIAAMLFVAVGLFSVAANSFATPLPSKVPFPRWPTDGK